jgi:hypothetical protein
MPTLSSNIVKREVASPKDVELALARQSLHGGDLVTNLLEVAHLNEERLLRTIAESLGLEAAPAGELPPTGDGLLRLVPSDLARRHGFFPLSEEGGSLIVAVSEPLGGDAESDLEFSLGVKLVQKAATLVRVKQALARDYGVPLDRRSARVVARLDGKPDPSPSVPPGPVARREPTVPPEGLPEHAARRGSSASLDFRALAGRGPRYAAPRRRIGPYTVAMAEHDLLDASQRDQLVTAFFDFASQYFEYAALFVVQGDLAEGRDAHGSGAPRAKVQGIGVPLDLPSSLSLVISGREPFRLARLAPSGIDGALVKDLERKPGPLVLLVPVRVRDRAVLVLYGDHGDHDVRLEAVGDVISFLPLVSAALERVILKRKGIAPRPSIPPRSIRPGEPSRVSVPPTRRLSTEPPRPIDHSPTPRPVLSVGPAPRHPTPAPVSLAPPLAGHDASHVIAAATGATPPWLSAPSAADLPPPPPPPLIEPPDDVPARDSGEFEANEHGTKPGVGTESGEAVPDSSQRRPLSPAPHADTEPASAPPDDDEDDAPYVGPSATELLQSLVAGDPRAADRLVSLGLSAVPVLVGALPGPITSELRRGPGDGPPRASDCGPLLKVLARIGPKAASMVAVRASDTDPAIRAWATRLLGEMPSADAAEAVALRFLDQDIEVRRAALAAGRMLHSHPAASESLSNSLSDVLADPAKTDEVRHMAIEAIADLREARAVPGLIRALESGSNEIRRSAHWALVVLTRQDFKDDPAFWEAWWLENSARHRIEWLIDALMHAEQEIRRAAGDELKSSTKEYFGYYDDLSPRERERAQGRYRDWWNSKGKLRFR